MAEMEITSDQLGTIDTNQIAQISLKDGTLIMVNAGVEQEQQVEQAEQTPAEEEFVQEEQAQEEQVQEEQVQEGQENQLRHRPMMPLMKPPMRPAVIPMRPVVPPVRPIVAPVPVKPIRPKLFPEDQS